MEMTIQGVIQVIPIEFPREVHIRCRVVEGDKVTNKHLDCATESWASARKRIVADEEHLNLASSRLAVGDVYSFGVQQLKLTEAEISQLR